MSTVYQDEIVCILNTVDKEIEPVRKKLKHLIVNVSNLKTVFPDIRIRIGQEIHIVLIWESRIVSERQNWRS